MGIFDDYKIYKGKHKTVNIMLDNRQPFSKVYHVTHIPLSKYLLETKKIIPNLIQDKSILNSERIKVIWLSPNTWAHGSLYGNIRFSYDFNQLIENKNFYAVEVMKRYSPVACRILISNKNYSKHKLLSKYNPYKKYGGPWYINSHGENYYNKNCNIEFMFEDDLDVLDAEEIDFVKHHNSLCNIHHPESCQYLGRSQRNSEMIFISHILGNDISLKNMYYNNSTHKKREIKYVYKDVISALSKSNKFEGNLKSKKIKVQICKSVLDLIGKEKNDKALVLSKSLNSKDDLESTMRKIFCKYFNIKEDKFIKEK